MLDNPNYYYDMIPYTYVLGIQNEWFRKMDSLNLVSPNWYKEDLNSNKLKKEIDSCLRLISNAVSIKPVLVKKLGRKFWKKIFDPVFFFKIIYNKKDKPIIKSVETNNWRFIYD